ncbi:hypothetical protein G7Y41_07065 [Schaalia sp. ZJ405]|uniref:hypothetical protein n=1 Tax=Schaalia sp. ZJ405 TaxID=2709403 RepID=UPI0013EDA44B|nr:hypothetical protein [Schaalia sp. ZJ405]QPK80813.1 hypothetical protein G7Y41_07065 [Schaalia sp. ZJ405]
MSDTTADTTAQTTTDEAPANEATQEDQAARPTTDWEKEAKKWEARSKANFAAVKERDALAEAVKAKDADLASLQAKVEAFEHERKLDSWKTKVASEVGVPANLLRGTTLDEIEEHGKALAQAFKNLPRGPVVPPTGAESDTKTHDLAGFVGELFGSKD